MPLHLGNISFESEYVLSYQKKDTTIVASAPNKEDVKELFEWIKKQTGL